jgi:hypothetical protein
VVLDRELPRQREGPVTLRGAVVGHANPSDPTRTFAVPGRRHGHRARRILEHLAGLVAEKHVRDRILPASADHDQVGVLAGGELLQAAAHRWGLDPRDRGGNLPFISQPAETLDAKLSCFVVGSRVRLRRGLALDDLHVDKRDLAVAGQQRLSSAIASRPTS